MISRRRSTRLSSTALTVRPARPRSPGVGATSLRWRGGIGVGLNRLGSVGHGLICSPAKNAVTAVVEQLLAEPRGLLTVLVGEDEPPLDGLLERIANAYPELEVDVQQGGQPHYHLLLSAE